LDGVYTAEQAGRGQETYAQVCAACHPLDWYKGASMKSWEGATLMGLYDSMATTMPQTNPGSLKRREYVALLAYILSLNELPTGSDELPEAADVLGKIVIKWRNKP
jgi:S-disulfanyl-L-cysteine oxidoreductase SoxD